MRSRFTCLLCFFSRFWVEITKRLSSSSSPKHLVGHALVVLRRKRPKKLFSRYRAAFADAFGTPFPLFSFPTFSERGSAAGEDRHARGHHRPQNGTEICHHRVVFSSSSSSSSSSSFETSTMRGLSLFARSAPKALSSSYSFKVSSRGERRRDKSARWRLFLSFSLSE